MRTFIVSLATAPGPQLKAVVRLGSVACIVALGLLRTSTEAEYAFASASIVPIVIVTWVGGQKEGLLFSLLAALMWASADWLSVHRFNSEWTPVINGLTRLATYGLVSYLTARVRKLLAQEQEWASRDALTGLLNRRAFLDAGEAEARRAARYGRPMALLFLDLDNFKDLNDRLGHKAGDSALIAASDALRSSVRSTDFVARMGGDEFAVLLSEIDFEATEETSAKLAAAVDRALKGYSPVSASIGAAWFAHVPDTFDIMLGAADALMYEAKRAGKHGLRLQNMTA